jgi:predicted P-loop ATPase
VFCGTVNPEQGRRFLNDATGNRRYWPVLVQKTEAEPIDTDALLAERDQLWAEALARFEGGEPWFMPSHLVSALNNLHEAVQPAEVDPWLPVVQAWAVTIGAGTMWTTAEIAGQSLSIQRKDLDQRATRRICRCLEALGWTAERTRTNGHQVRVWVAPLPPSAEVEP